jgi:hypothetical protein
VRRPHELALHNQVFDLPSAFGGGSAPAAAEWFLPVLPAAALAYALGAGLEAAEASAARPVRGFDLLLSCATVAAASLSGYAVGLATGDPACADFGRNTAFIVGLTLVVRALFREAAVVASVLWPLCVALFGYHGSPVPYHWTILPEPPGAWYAALGAAFALLVGLAAQLRTPASTA